MNTKDIKTSSELSYKTSKIIVDEGKKINIHIWLSDSFENGVERFAIVSTIKYEDDSNLYGCSHEEMLKYYPEFKLFADLHLRTFKGLNNSCISNGYYLLKNGFNKTSLDSPNFIDEYCEYFNCTKEHFNVLAESESENEFKMLSIELGLIKLWQEEAAKGIEELEKLTGLRFKSKSKYSIDKVTATKEEIKQFRERKKNGYYSKEAKQKRACDKIEALKKEMINKVNDEFYYAVLSHEKEKNIKLELIRLGFEIDVKSGNIKGAIYYTHSNELNFNWSTEKIKESDILAFIKNVDKTKFKGLKVSDNKKLISTI